MYTKVWDSCYASVCQLSFLNERGISIDCLTGFKVDNSLVTSQQAFYVENAHKVEISFVDQDASTVTASIRIPYSEFIDEMRIGVRNDDGHYAIFNLDLPDFRNIPSLTMNERLNYSIGSNVAMLAFNGGCCNLSIRTGYISSHFINNKGVRFLQFDGQTCFGNSGAPLIDPNSNEVIGIVSRRNSPASKAYNQLLDILSTNLDALNGLENIIKLGDLDPIQAIIASQRQIKHLASTVYMHSSTGITDVVMLDRVISYFNNKVNHQQEQRVHLPEEAEFYIG